MDKQLSTGTVAGIIALVVIVLGLVAWRYLGNQGVSQDQQRAQQGMQQDYLRRMQSGQPQVGVSPGGPPGAPQGPR